MFTGREPHTSHQMLIMETITSQENRLTPAQNRFYYLTMGFAAIFIGSLSWSVVNPPAIYMDLWGKYPSRYEADRACTFWKVREITRDVKAADYKDFKCIQDGETRQYLGLRNDFVVKYFRF